MPRPRRSQAGAFQYSPVPLPQRTDAGWLLECMGDGQFGRTAFMTIGRAEISPTYISARLFIADPTAQNAAFTLTANDLLLTRESDLRSMLDVVWTSAP